LARPSPRGTCTSYSLPACLAHSELGQSRRFCEIRIDSANPLIAAVRRCAAIRWVQLTLGVIEPADNPVERFMREDSKVVDVQ
jgi:hypothetical protein